MQLTSRNASATRVIVHPAREAPSSTSYTSKTGRVWGTYAPWIIQGALALIFLFAGVTKLVMSAEDLTVDIDLPASFLRFIGACEVLGAFGLTLPGLLRFRRGLTPLAAICLVVIMIGATVITIAVDGLALGVFPFVVGVMAASVAYARRGWFTAA